MPPMSARRTRDAAKHAQVRIKRNADAFDSDVDDDKDGGIASSRAKTPDIELPNHLRPWTSSAVHANCGDPGAVGKDVGEISTVDNGAVTNAKEGDISLDGPRAAEPQPGMDSDDQVQPSNDSWLTRLWSRLSFAAAAAAPGEAVLSSGGLGADDETTKHAITQATRLLAQDLRRLQIEHAAGSYTLARLGCDSFHVDAMLPQQMADRDATEEWLHREADLKVADAQCKLSRALWGRYRAANEMENKEVGDGEGSNISARARGRGLEKAFECFRRNEDQRVEAQARLEAAEKKRAHAKETVYAFRSETESRVQEAQGRLDRAAKRLRMAKGWN